MVTDGATRLTTVYSAHRTFAVFDTMLPLAHTTNKGHNMPVVTEDDDIPNILIAGMGLRELPAYLHAHAAVTYAKMIASESIFRHDSNIEVTWARIQYVTASRAGLWAAIHEAPDNCAIADFASLSRGVVSIFGKPAVVSLAPPASSTFAPESLAAIARAGPFMGAWAAAYYTLVEPTIRYNHPAQAVHKYYGADVTVLSMRRGQDYAGCPGTAALSGFKLADMLDMILDNKFRLLAGCWVRCEIHPQSRTVTAAVNEFEIDSPELAAPLATVSSWAPAMVTPRVAATASEL